MKIILILLYLSVTGFTTNLTNTQSNNPIQWHYAVEKKSNHESMLIITAQLASGWHVYSQFMQEGGPLPTSFSFRPSNDFVVAGKPEEKGNPVRFHDDIYDMVITWYAGQVSFLQRVHLLQPATTVSGTITYMICNYHSCVPGKQEFYIPIAP